MRSPLVSLILAFSTLVGLSSGASAQALVEGVWTTPELSEMTIAPCEQGFCGTLSKIVITPEQVAQYGVAPEQIDIASLTDTFNEDPALKSRPMLGLQILTLRATDNPWRFEGEIYNPRDGKTYSGSIDVMGADSVLLKGCALYVLCQEQVWTRAPVVEEVVAAQ